MPQVDLPLDQLRDYRPALNAPADLAEFWDGTLASSRAAGSPPRLERADSPLEVVETFDVRFSGFAGDEVRAWLSVPAGASRPLPVVVDYIGYGGGRGRSHQFVSYALTGYAHLVVDNRGMGGWGAIGATPDPHPEAGLNKISGFMTSGIRSPQEHWLRRLITDAVLAVDAARAIPLVDAESVAVAGSSMGGGLALAVSGLAAGLQAAMVDVPFLSHYPRAIRIADAGPYLEVAEYLKLNNTMLETVERTLSYFDAAILGAGATAPGLFSVGLMDGVCPPSTVFAGFHNYGGERKEIRVYPFNGHEGGAVTHELERFAWVREHLPRESRRTP